MSQCSCVSNRCRAIRQNDELRASVTNTLKKLYFVYCAEIFRSAEDSSDTPRLGKECVCQEKTESGDICSFMLEKGLLPPVKG